LKTKISTPENINSPLVSVIMNCHNGQKFLKEAVVSIVNQTYEKFELIFFNNFSSDQSENIVKSFNDKRIKYFNSESYLNLYQARNEALKYSKGEYVTFLDTDDLWENNKIEKQLEFFKRNKNAKILYTNYYLFTSSKTDKKIFFKNQKSSGKITQELLNSYSVGIITTMVKKSVFDKYNFKNNYTIIGDFDFYLNCSLEYPIHYLDLPLAYYRWHGDNLSNKRVDVYYKELNEWHESNKKKLLSLGFSLFNLRLVLIKLYIKFFLKKFFKLNFMGM
tara:strand:- start:1784 stop:2614 length:831 start_codon:yes stop_codon:yes gene_type:complete